MRIPYVPVSAFFCLLFLSGPVAGPALAGEGGENRILFYGRSTSVGYMKQFERELGVRIDSFDKEDAVSGYSEACRPDLIVLLWGYRGGRQAGFLSSDEVGARFERFLRDAKKDRPDLRIIASASARRGFARSLPGCAAAGFLEEDGRIDPYLAVGMDRSNLKRLLVYLATTYLGHKGTVESPREDVPDCGIFHPSRESFFGGVGEFLDDARKRGVDVEGAPRAMVLAISSHFAVRNFRGVEALLRELEARGVLAFAYVTGRSAGSIEDAVKAFRPLVILDTRHRRGDPELRERLNIPFLHCMWLSRLSIEEWRESSLSTGSVLGLTGGELAGAIEPHVISGKESPDGPEVFVPIDDRIERVVGRALAWIRLAGQENAAKKVAIFGAASTGGTPDNKLLNVPRSAAALLMRLKEEGYTLGPDLPDAARLLEEWEGREVDAARPAELDRLARSGGAALVPVDDYLGWFERKVPASRRFQVVEKFGPPPGNWHVWTDDRGRSFFVVPRIELGNVLLLSSGGLPPWADRNFEDVRRRMNDGQPFTPSHNIIATAFWLEEGYGADALLYFGSFSIDLLLPEKTVGLSSEDWPDILMGNLPNIRPFSLTATTFAVPARRRSSAVLVNHLTPPLEAGGLADELLTLSNDIVKWESLGEGALRERFRASITDQVTEIDLDADLHLDLAGDRSLSDDEIRAAASYLTMLEGERICTTSHVLGEEPPIDLLVPQLVACVGPAFLDALEGALSFPADADRRSGGRQKIVREKAEEIADLVARKGLAPVDALAAAGIAAATVATGETPDRELIRACEQVADLRAAYGKTHREIDNILRALDGGFVPPGPANPPERNPASVPTGRNTYFLDPEAVPSRASWELGKELVDRLLERKRAGNNGVYPTKVAVSVMTKSTMMDFGVAESQILYLIGVRPVWSRGRVLDVELIPAEELGRPRIDVVVETKHHYNDYLESRTRLIDRAIRMVCELDEEGNNLFDNRRRIRDGLVAEGIAVERAETLSRARIFSVPPGSFGSGLHDVLFESTGLWDAREQLAEVYLAQHDFVYTMGCWGEKAPKTYRRQLAGTEIVLRNIGKHGALTGRAGYSGGSLCLAIETLSGRAPDYFISDLRLPGRESIERAEDLLRRDFRAVLFNRKWIEGMKGEGANGASRMAALTWKTLSWQINRSESVSREIWEEITDTYVRDSRNLNLREFFEQTDPGAFQEIAGNLLEAVRKEYWNAGRVTILELASELARSIARHGRSIDPNERLDRFVEGTLLAEGSDDTIALLEAFRDVAADPAPGPAAPSLSAGAPESAPAEPTPDEAAPADRAPALEHVSGKELAPEPPPAIPTEWIIGAAALLLVAAGVIFRKGAL